MVAYLAYVAESDLYLVDLATDVNPEVIRFGVLRAVFVNDAQLWFEEESDGGCVTQERQVRVYDVRDGSEAPSIVDYVDEVWPQTSSAH